MLRTGFPVLLVIILRCAFFSGRWWQMRLPLKGSEFMWLQQKLWRRCDRWYITIMRTGFHFNHRMDCDVGKQPSTITNTCRESHTHISFIYNIDLYDLYDALSLSLCMCIYIYICTPIHLALNECTRRGQTTRVAIDATDFFLYLINFAYETFHLEGKHAQFWSPKVNSPYFRIFSDNCFTLLKLMFWHISHGVAIIFHILAITTTTNWLDTAMAGGSGRGTLLCSHGPHEALWVGAPGGNGTGWVPPENEHELRANWVLDDAC